MKNKKLIEWLKDCPEDYDINFSQYTSIVYDEDGKDEEYFIVLDDPITGILKNDDTKEIRLFTQTSKERVIKKIESGENWKKLI